MKKLIWLSKMALGFICYWPVMLLPLSDNRFYMWLLSWAGFFAFDAGYRA